MKSGAFRAARILYPGPSLAEAISMLQGCGSDALFIGVNRAVEAWECDYWCAIDWKTIDEGKPKGKPEIITISSAKQRLNREVCKVYGTRGTYEDMPPADTGWLNYSSLLAIAAAYDMGFKRIEVYGADMKGVEDWDGNQVGRVQRSELRWAKERAQFGKLVEWLNSKGVAVIR
jgi:hypothetical protein